MSKSDWQAIGVLGAVIGLLVAFHGVTTQRWERLHTAGVVLGAAAVLGPRLTK